MKQLSARLLYTAGMLLFLAGLASAQVDTVWVRHYKYNPRGYSEAKAIAVDRNGNVYVTGISYGTTTETDIATIKYSPDGDTLWVQRYDASSLEDEAYSLVLDDSSNVYVTGGSANPDETWDCVTIKYSPDGEVRWVARYNGPGNDDDWANDIAVDGEGNVYVTGTSVTSWPDFDIVTIKYNRAGQEQWVARYAGIPELEDEAAAIAVDADRNVYVTGICNRAVWPAPDTASRLITIKYAQNGTPTWVTTYNGPVNGPDVGCDIAVDDDRSVYVAGITQENREKNITIKYQPDGSFGWIRTCGNTIYTESWDGPSVVLDRMGNICVGSTIDNSINYSWYDFLTIKYRPDGETLWVRTYNGPAGDESDVINDITVDSQGSVYVTGRGRVNPYNQAFITVKYLANGTQAWEAIYNPRLQQQDWDEAWGIAVDDAGYVYVTGYSTDLGYATIKYTQATGIAETMKHNPSLPGYPTILQSHLHLSLPEKAELLDAAGRKVMALHAGENDMRHLAPGVYFVSTGTKSRSVQKVVVTR